MIEKEKFKKEEKEIINDILFINLNYKMKN